jgi:hypothetical protein
MYDGPLDAARDGARLAMKRFGLRALFFAAAITVLAVRDGNWGALLLAPMLGVALPAGGATAAVARHATAPLQQNRGGDLLSMLLAAVLTVGVVVGLLLAFTYLAVAVGR